jgi:hypothetical protein
LFLCRQKNDFDYLLKGYLASVVDEIADDTGNAYGVHQACPTNIRLLVINLKKKCKEKRMKG